MIRIRRLRLTVVAKHDSEENLRRSYKGEEACVLALKEQLNEQWEPKHLIGNV